MTKRLGCLMTVFAADSRDAMIDAQVKTGEKINSEQGNTLSDGMARVYQVKGKAVMVKKDSPIEVAVKVGDKIQAGDTIYTPDGASVSIAFDYLKKNAVQIPPASRALFNSIEPTDIKLESGSVFSAVDGLPQGSSWKVTTPVAVAAVRGTVYLVRFETASGEFYTATVDIPDDGKSSAVDIHLIEKDGEANVPEGKEITLREGDPLGPDLVQDLSPEAIAEIRKFFEELKSEREEVEEQAAEETSSPSGDAGDSENGDGMDDLGTGDKETESPVMENQPELDPLEDFKENIAKEDEPEYKTCNSSGYCY
jgi:hypothetical protein